MLSTSVSHPNIRTYLISYKTSLIIYVATYILDINVLKIFTDYIGYRCDKESSTVFGIKFPSFNIATDTEVDNTMTRLVGNHNRRALTTTQKHTNFLHVLTNKYNYGYDKVRSYHQEFLVLHLPVSISNSS